MFPTGFNPLHMQAGSYPTLQSGGLYAGAVGNVPSYGHLHARPGGGGFHGLLNGHALANATMSTSQQAAPERFVTSQSGGVIVGKDGAPSGRVPAGSFVDLKDGSVYDAAGKKVELAEGSSVDFFDLDDITRMSSAYNGMQQMGTTTGAGPTSGKPAYDQSQILGQWGPGGVTDFTKGKGGATSGGVDQSGCAHSHGSDTAVAGASGAGTGAAAKGGGAASMPDLQAQLAQGLAQLASLGVLPTGGVTGGGGYMHPTRVAGQSGAGAKGALGGYSNIGMMPLRLEHSLQQLVLTLRELVAALATTSATAGASGSGTTSEDTGPDAKKDAASSTTDTTSETKPAEDTTAT